MVGEDGSEAECPVCLEECTPAAFATSLSCHCRVCKNCLSSHIRVRLEGGDTAIACPTCSSTLHRETIKGAIEPALFRRYSRLAAAAEEDRRVAADPLLAWCPTPDCATVVTRKPGVALAQCSRCCKEMCFECRRPAHKRLSCQEAQTKFDSEAELAYQRWAKKMTKHCPEPSCQAPIERAKDDTGPNCNHMICSKCHTEFCWLCGRKVPPIGHFDVTNILGCPGLQYSGPDVDVATRIGARMRALRLRSASGLKTGAKVGAVGLVCIVATPFVLAALIPYGGYRGIQRLRK